MNYLKNVSDTVVNVKDLIKIKDNQVISLALSKVENVDIRYFSLAQGEEINNEQYPMDTYYLCLEGELIINIDGVNKTLSNLDMVAVAMGTKSSIVADQNSIMLQIMLKE